MGDRIKDNVSELKYVGIYHILKYMRQIQCLDRGMNQYEIRKDWHTLLDIPNCYAIVRYILSMCDGVTLPRGMVNIIGIASAGYNKYTFRDGRYDIERIKQLIEDGQH